MLGVLASMAALAMERSRDVGLMKALGGPVPRVMRLFLAEAGALGVVGGTIGFFAGIVLARWIGERVFGVAISPRLVVFPVTVALTDRWWRWRERCRCGCWGACAPRRFLRGE